MDLANDYDMVLLDCSPILGVSDPLVVSSIADATILVVRSGSTKKARCDRQSSC